MRLIAKRFLIVALFAKVMSSSASAQTAYYWNNSGTDWLTGPNWTSQAGVNLLPGATDLAQFTPYATTGGLLTTPPAVTQPIITGAATTANVSFASTASGTGWNLTGSGSLTSGATAVGSYGIYSQGPGSTSTINLGTGAATSLTLTGPTGTTGGNLVVANGSTLILGGNTVAATTGTALTSIRGGTLVLDNSSGNPTSQRFTTANAVNLNGGGSTLEFRGAGGGGTTFSGFTGALGASGSGDTTLRMVQSGSAPLNVSFTAVTRVNNAGSIYFENIGSGFIGDAGKPTITFTNAFNNPTGWQTNSGIISTSAANPLGYAFVTNRTSNTNGAVVTGRVANYSGTSVLAAATTPYSGDVSTAPTANTGVLFNPSTGTAYSYNIPANPQVQSVILEPAIPGVTLSNGAGFNTNVVLHSGANDIVVNSTSNFLAGTSGTRTVNVLNPGSSVTTNGSLNIVGSGNPTVIGGGGTLILNSSTNAIGTTSGAVGVLNLAGGTLRVNASNFVLNAGTGVRLNFRGGVLEYDVSAAPANFSLSLGTVLNTFSWTSNAGDLAATNVGSGGFAAFSTVAGNTLTVNIGGASAPMVWNDNVGATLFVTDGYALKFGSPLSNATVNFQNPINLNAPTAAAPIAGAYRAREINVTRGTTAALTGNANRATLSGIVSGPGTSDLVKTGAGVLELTAANTYSGNTIVQNGILLATNTTSATGTGSVLVQSGGTLSGLGTITPTGTFSGVTGAALNNVTVFSGGTIAPGTRFSDASSTGTLTVASPVVVKDGAAVAWKLGNATPASGGANSGTSNSGTLQDQIAITGSGNVLLAGNITFAIRETVTPSFVPGSTYSWLVVSGNSPGLASLGTVAFDLSNAPTFSAFGGAGALSLAATGTSVFLNFVPVPEPASLLLIGMAGTGLAGLVRRRRIQSKA